MSLLLAAAGLRKSFGATIALTDAHLRVDAGEVVAIMGPSGSGKSTLLHCAAGILRPGARPGAGRAHRVTGAGRCHHGRALAHQRVDIGPLGVVRRAAPARRRLLWRLVPIGAGVAMLLVSAATGGESALLLMGLAVLLLGVLTLVPWLVDVAARTLRPAGIATQLAVRRLQADPGTAARAVAGVVAVLTAGLTLQAVQVSLTSEHDQSTAATVAQRGDARYEVYFNANDSVVQAATLAERLRALEGVREVFTVRRGAEWQPEPELAGEPAPYREPLHVQVRECAQLQALGVRSCAPSPVTGGLPVRDVTLVDQINRAVLAGSLAIALLAALSQLITSVDQTYERRRQLATLAVFGVRRRTLAAALLWQTAVPLLAGLALAVPAALATTYLLLTVIDAGNPRGVRTPLVVPWVQVGWATGVAALLVMVVSLTALPALRRVTRPDAVRFE